MDKQAIFEAVSKRKKGTCIRLVVNRPAEVLKKAAGEAGEIRKRTAYSLQLASYGNRAPVKTAVESGEREAPKTPAWVVKVETLENGLRFWHHANGQVYLALPVFGDKGRARVQWTRNGEKVEKKEIESFLTAKEKTRRPSKSETEERGQAQFNAIKLENIEKIR